ncbi:MAG: hypothetical protein PHO76_12635 [Methylotenera sp.]|nr:hypothetical protein [Methylotenera sp.]MDD4926812.1 hypothetical protein [Methylotenera sp.]
MTFQLGQSKPVNSGRRKGSINKSTIKVQRRVQAILGADPLDELTTLAQEIATSDPKLHFLILKELSRYCHSHCSVKSTGPDESPCEDLRSGK